MTARRRKSTRERARMVVLRYRVRSVLSQSGAMEKLYSAVMSFKDAFKEARNG